LHICKKKWDKKKDSFKIHFYLDPILLKIPLARFENSTWSANLTKNLLMHFYSNEKYQNTKKVPIWHCRPEMYLQSYSKPFLPICYLLDYGRDVFFVWDTSTADLILLQKCNSFLALLAINEKGLFMKVLKKFYQWIQVQMGHVEHKQMELKLT